MKSILILSTCYDAASYYTSRWAARLHNKLVKQQKTICMHYDATSICRAGEAIGEAIDRADYVIFYGHGSRDEWIALPELPMAQPPVSSSPLVDVNSVAMLKERRVYANCCSSLGGLGQQYVAAYPAAEFVGYDQEFDFDFATESHFEEVVKNSIVAYINGTPAKQVATDLRSNWAGLRDRFAHGDLKYEKTCHTAMLVADQNSKRVGSLPTF